MNRSGLTTRDRTRTTRRADARGLRPRPGPVPEPADRRRRPVSRRHRAARGAVGVLVLLLGVWLLWAGPLLSVATVRVDGVTTLPAEVVREAAGIAPGTPLLQVDVAAADARVSALPQVASAEVTRGWPRTVVVTVVERVPVAVVGGPGNRSLLDAEGVLFDSISAGPPPGVVELVVADPGPEDPATRAAVTAIRALPRGLLDQVAQVRAPAADDLSLSLVDGTLVRWGDAQDSPAKGAALDALVDQIASGALEPAGTIDVTVPTAVVLR